jgi:hypothetical protein
MQGSALPLGVRLLPAAVGLLCVASTCVLVGLGGASSVGLWLKFGYLAPLLLIGGGGWALARSADSPSAQVALTVLMLCAGFLVLVGNWQAGVSDGFILGGLLPYSDAQGYYSDALRLLSGRRFSIFSSRRPLFSTFLAGLLAVTGLDLRITLTLLMGIAVTAICCAAREVRRTLGVASGVFMLLCLFMFYRRYIGTTLTEHLGVGFGCLAFCLIWRGAVALRPGPVLVGLFFLSLGLNARAGAFLILPAIACWAAWELRGPHRSRRWILGSAAAAVLLGFAVNALVLHMVAIPGAAYSNFSYSLYGMVFGGDWGLALQRHPELATLPPLDQAGQVYNLAWAQIRAHPLSLATGCLAAWKSFFIGRSEAWFSFVLYLPTLWSDMRETLPMGGWAALDLRRDLWLLLDGYGRTVWIVVLNGLMIGGLLVLARNHRDRLARLQLAAWGGILLSVPFAPPWDADSMRAYAATIPFVVALPLMGLSFWRPRGAAWWQDSEATAGSSRTPVVALVMALLVLQGLGLFLVGASGALADPAGREAACAPSCQGAGQATRLYLDPRIALHLVGTREKGMAEGAGLSLDARSLRVWESARRHSLWHIWRGLARLPDDTTLALAFDVRQGSAVYLRSDSRIFPPLGGQVMACGQRVNEGWISWLAVDSFEACGDR